MKYLTAPYLTLMHAFKAHADLMLEKYKPYGSPVELLAEYGTLRLDGGRQSGKTEATVQFCIEWLENGGCVYIISPRMQNSDCLKRRLDREWHNRISPRPGDEDCMRYNVITDTMRAFISDGGTKARGRTLNRILYIIDEPMNVPSLHKFYEAHFKGPFYACCQQTDKPPLFFVIGMQ